MSGSKDYSLMVAQASVGYAQMAGRDPKSLAALERKLVEEGINPDTVNLFASNKRDPERLREIAGELIAQYALSGGNMNTAYALLESIKTIEGKLPKDSTSTMPQGMIPYPDDLTLDEMEKAVSDTYGAQKVLRFQDPEREPRLSRQAIINLINGSAGNNTTVKVGNIADLLP